MNQLSATFVKVDFTAGEAKNRLDELSYRAEADYNHMVDFEQQQKQEIEQFRNRTELRAKKIRK
jgi:low affinity Fe/Cu permease